jgi:hypothetical protein
MVTGTSTLSSN